MARNPGLKLLLARHASDLSTLKICLVNIEWSFLVYIIRSSLSQCLPSRQRNILLDMDLITLLELSLIVIIFWHIFS